ncbi:SNF2 family N-terminal domain-containing protein [Scenedesmus sp. NREL 46B-D3]|nr:SNF2 family N-terminal domain-containing protein [Scenedesmus sp. NREL 46B-D3]
MFKASEYDVVDSSLPLAERVAKQRQQIRERLGLGRGFGGKGLDDVMNTDELLGEEDIEAALAATPGRPRSRPSSSGRGDSGSGGKARSSTPPEGKQAAASLLRSDSLMSARERNKLKRKAKALGRQDSTKPGGADAKGRVAELMAGERGGSEAGSREVSPALPLKQAAAATAGGAAGTAAGVVAGAGVASVLTDEQAAEQDMEEWHNIEAGSWPFQRVADQLCCDILSPAWPVRHGAAAGLRELLREQAAAAAVEAPWLMPPLAGHRQEGLRNVALVSPGAFEAAATANAAWLEDVVMHLLCVLALDRFADYVSDQVVVPVRETAAQALGAALQPTSLLTLQRVLELLSSMHKHHEWSVRHGAFTGGGAAAAAALPVLMAGLGDKDDSVQAAAAEALVPMAPLLLAADSDQAVARLRHILWDLLSSMEEELSVATSSSLSLLAALYSPPARFQADAALAARLPVLWPFLSHSTTGVRLAAAASLGRLAAAGAAAAAVDAGAAAGAAAGAGGAWLRPVVGPTLRLLHQCLVTEREPRVQRALLQAWASLLQHARAADVCEGLSGADMCCMLNLMATPCGSPLDTGLLVVPLQGRLVAWGSSDAEEAGFCVRPAKKLKQEPGSNHSSRPGSASGCGGPSGPAQDVFGANGSGSFGSGLDPGAWVGMDDQEAAVRMRLLASKAVGQLCVKLQGQEPPLLPGLLLQQLQAIAASSRVAASLNILHWLQLAADTCRAASTAADADTAAAAAAATAAAEAARGSAAALSAAISAVVPEQLPDSCLAYLSAPGPSMPSYPAAEPYVELAPLYAKMRRELYALVNACLQVGVVLQAPSSLPLDVLPADGCVAMAASVPAAADGGEAGVAKQTVLATAQHLQLLEHYLHTSACLVLAAVVVASGRLPAKLNCVIQNLMAGLRKEPCRELQAVAASALAELMASCASRQPCPNDKLVKNLCVMACGDGCDTPCAAAAEGLRGRAARPLQPLWRGLFEVLPSVWGQMSGALSAAAGADGAPGGDPQGLIHAMQLASCLRHSNAAVRLAAARCLAALAAAQPEAVLPPLLKQAVPLLDGTTPMQSRLGGVELMATLMLQLQRQLVPYAVMLVVPLLRRMSDAVPAVRRKAALCFGSLTALLPLAHGLPLPEGLDEGQRAAAQRDGEFLAQLLDNRRVGDYSLPMQLKVELRRYQQEGINWLSFLRRFGLNGVLADDMGLGKTLQATTIMACSAAERQAATTAAATTAGENGVQQQAQQGQPPPGLQQHAVAGSEPAAAAQLLPSLVVCPSTLVGHWAHEINKYVDDSVLRPLAISGTPAERSAAQQQLSQGGAAAGGRYNVVITSYESLRSDADWASGIPWDYVVLDEGHVIRSTKSKLAQAVKRLQAQHRLVLSGTPIQNSALELWSLFDFLMPGFLGAERDFNSRFGRVVSAARYSKKGSREAEAGTLALDALHKQVMPFILRRTKAQVLQDLPPKIVTDVMCRMSSIQQRLYEDFASSQALSEVTSTLTQQQQAAADDSSSSSKSALAAEGKAAQHVFSALIYLRKLCSHPLLALDWSVPAHRDACQLVLGPAAAASQAAAEQALRGIEHAPKLLALQDILVQCGLVSPEAVLGGSGNGSGSGRGGAAAREAEELAEGSSDSGHRLLVFAQLKGMLDLVEGCLLRPLGVSSLRLDGSVDAGSRFGVVQRFNSDPTIQVLLLTTHVGGLGLNLTSADTVVFLEHDWNPMKDLQAMDRAHRIGQTRTVNVYRLLMQDTLEQRIMSLQRFKLDVADAVVNQDNMSMSAMDTGQLLDLFGTPAAAAEKQERSAARAAGVDEAAAAAAGAGGGEGAAAGGAGGRKKQSALQAMVDGMGELWDEGQYTAEFDMKSFMQKLAKKQQQ